MMGEETGIAIKIQYWAPFEEKHSLHDIVGIEEFKNELSENYLATIHSRPAGLGGGFHELYIEISSVFSLKGLLKIILEGTAFDLIKSGSKAFVLRPFLHAYRKLKQKKKNDSVDIGELKIVFADSVVSIYKITNNSIFDQLEKIFHELARNYSNLVLANDEIPYEIHIPVFKDDSTERIIEYRTLLDVDETINSVMTEDYFRFWGCEYDFSCSLLVYDVNTGALLEKEFYTKKRYWDEWNRRRSNRS